MMRAWKGIIRSHWGMWLVLLAPVIAYHWKILLLGHWIQGGDFINQFAPWRHFALSEVLEGRFPFWNPYVFCGAPFAANIQTALFYPENLLHLVLPVEGVFSLSLVAHQALAALAMYGFLYYLVQNKAGAAFGAVVYAWSGFLVTHAHDGHLIHARAYAFIPLALWMQSLMLTERGRRAWAGLAGMAAALAMMFYAGHTQLPLYIFYALLFRAVWHGGAHGFAHGFTLCEWRKAAFPLIWTGVGLALSLVAAMLVLAPLAELSQHTASRAGGAEYAFAVSDSMPPSFLISFVAPFFYGDPTHPEREHQFWLTSTGYHELCGYTGILSLLLIVLAFLPRRAPPANDNEWMRRRDFYFFLLVAGGGLFFALGEFNPLYPLLYYGLPGWSYFRVPARLVLLFIIGVCVCSAWGLAAWRQVDLRQAINSSAGKCAVILSCLPLFAWVILWLSKPGMLAWLRQFEVERTVEVHGLWTVPRSQISAQLPEVLFEARFAEMTQSLGMAVLMLGLGWLALLGMNRWGADPAQLGDQKGLDDHKGRPYNDGLFIHSNGKERFSLAALLPIAVLLLDLLIFSHRFIPTQAPDAWREAHYPQTVLVEFLQGRGERVIELDDAIGHPGLAHHPELRPNRLMGYGVASARGYDPLILERYARHVNRLYNRPENEPQGGLLFFTEPPEPNRFAPFAAPYVITSQPMQAPYQRVWEKEGSPVRVYHFADAFPEIHWADEGDDEGIEVISKTASQMELRLQSEETRRLVWAQTHYPGWSARLNGKRVDVAPYDEVWVSVEVPAGEHALTLFFEGRVFVLGALLSGMGAFALVMILVFAARARRDS